MTTVRQAHSNLDVPIMLDIEVLTASRSSQFAYERARLLDGMKKSRAFEMFSDSWRLTMIMSQAFVSSLSIQKLALMQKANTNQSPSEGSIAIYLKPNESRSEFPLAWCVEWVASSLKLMSTHICQDSEQTTQMKQ